MKLTRAQSTTLGIGSLCLLLLTSILDWRAHQAEQLELAALRSELDYAQTRLSVLVVRAQPLQVQPEANACFGTIIAGSAPGANACF